MRKNGVTHYGDKTHVAVDHATTLRANGDVPPAKSSRRCWILLLPVIPGHMPTVPPVRRTPLPACASGGQAPHHPQGVHGKPIDTPPDGPEPFLCHGPLSCRHVFGSIRNGTNACYTNCLGIKRSRAWSGLVTLCDNMKRFEYLERSGMVVCEQSCHTGPERGTGVYNRIEKGVFLVNVEWI